MKVNYKEPEDRPIESIEPEGCDGTIAEVADMLLIPGNECGPGRQVCHMSEIPKLCENLMKMHSQWQQSNGSGCLKQGTDGSCSWEKGNE